ncbi:Gfo/Idh/MocA family protein [Actinopolymorpha pittospori]|uniref:Dehydrogenase n=1 Tax=Actinopolymorpha pittospori TaxID=648752 RepID=A0A927R939_9ACTN|nr:Gfo/Idh/MocA family oxidoreductase [Actinopolymorpha pittospori]MBE1607397.1 putative dehydrogenase [Actinopolymorpha pittospori]
MAAEDRQINVAVVGLGFGSSFVPIYARHPHVGEVTICDISSERLHSVGDRHAITRRTVDFEEILRDDSIDAVHLVTPMPLHAEQSVAVMESGKHCACAVPLTTSRADVDLVVAAQRRTRKNYMMMETAVYTREFLFVQELVRSGQVGRIQFARGAHYSDYENWPRWKWYAPMQYATHAVAPLLALTGTRAKSVTCLGSGWMPAELSQPYGNPFPVETAIFELAGQDHPTAAEVTRTIFRTIRQELESFDIYGEHLSFEWSRRRGDESTLFRVDHAATMSGRHPVVVADAAQPPDRSELLPAKLQEFTSGGHGGSHPHLVHEFVSSIVDERSPAIDVHVAADWTTPGICAHESALAGGLPVAIPDSRTNT